MVAQLRGAALLGVVVHLVGSCGDSAAPGGVSSSGICSAAGLVEALAGAGPGDTVTVGRCRIEAAVVVPAGVTLAGRSRDESILAAGGDDVVVTLVPACQATQLVNLRIESDGRAGVEARGGGGVALSRVTIQATRGTGVLLQAVADARLADVRVQGPVDAATAAAISPWATERDTATNGLAALASGVRLERVDVSGFAKFGVLLVDSQTAWSGGSASGNRGVGLLVDGGRATLESVDLCGTFGDASVIPSYGGVLANGADVESTDLVVCDNADFGLLQSAATARHSNLVVTGNGGAGVWVQLSDGFAISGSGSRVSGNRGEGIVVLWSRDVAIADASIADTQLIAHVVESQAVLVGDGIELFATSEVVRLSHLNVANNARVGILIDLDGESGDDVVLEDIAVSGEGEQLGVVVQGGPMSPGWDAEIVRSGAVVANDAALAGTVPSFYHDASESPTPVRDLVPDILPPVGCPDTP